MKLRTIYTAGTILVLSGLFSFVSTDSDWGFFTHKRINQLAVYTLPQSCSPFFKKHIDYLKVHAIDADKRKFSTKFERVRHYIDIDVWETAPFDTVPRQWNQALGHYAEIVFYHGAHDSIVLTDSLVRSTDTLLSEHSFQQLINTTLVHNYYADEQVYLEPEVWEPYLDKEPDSLITSIKVVDHFSEYGILPFTLEKTYDKLVRAIKDQNGERILKYASDLGHYVGDAHVPLHTTVNYNGQFTGQDGIHGFWESRLPELYADDSYNYLVGRAGKIDTIRNEIWKIIEESHACLPAVFGLEKQLRDSLPPDQIICMENRNGIPREVKCEPFAKAYHEALDGMVESRMRLSVKRLGSFWYTAWLEAGSPDLNELEIKDVSFLKIDPEDDLAPLPWQNQNKTSKRKKKK